MKNLLLLFLLANILFFVGSAFSEKEALPGVAIIAENDLGPALVAVVPLPEDEAVSADPDSVAPVAIEAAVGRSCASIGPFRVMSDADTAVLTYSADGLEASRRATEMDVLLGHWVQIGNVSDLATANAILERLADGGLTDAYYVNSEQLISLGRFGDISGAETTEEQARALDIDAVTVPWTSNQLVYFVDVGFPPGRGASDMVEQYGEDQVALRDAATCP